MYLPRFFPLWKLFTPEWQYEFEWNHWICEHIRFSKSFVVQFVWLDKVIWSDTFSLSHSLRLAYTPLIGVYLFLDFFHSTVSTNFGSFIFNVFGIWIDDREIHSILHIFKKVSLFVNIMFHPQSTYIIFVLILKFIFLQKDHFILLPIS